MPISVTQFISNRTLEKSLFPDYYLNTTTSHTTTSDVYCFIRINGHSFFFFFFFAVRNSAVIDILLVNKVTS